MTLPDERYISLIRTRDFLVELQNPSGDWKKIADIRKEASRCLRHYPLEMHLEDLSDQSPNILENKDDHL